MTRIVRSLLLAGIAFVALAITGNAFAVFTPRLEINNPSERQGGAGPLTLTIANQLGHEPIFRIVFYVPEGYGAELGKAPGTAMGSVDAQINARAISPDAIVPVTGTATAADPAEYRTLPASVACAGAATFDAVILLNLTAAGQTLTVPVYAFTIASGPEAAFADAKLVVCFGNPNLPQAQGGSALGATPVNASITLNGVFVNPPVPGNFRWRALMTPWSATTPNAAGTVETQSIDAIPAQLALNARANRRTNRVTLSGTLTETTTGVGGATVQLYRGRTAGGVTRFLTVRTNARGAFTRTIRVPRNGAWFFRARVVVPTREGQCEATFSTQGIQCISATRAGFTIFSNRVVRVTT